MAYLDSEVIIRSCQSCSLEWVKWLIPLMLSIIALRQSRANARTTKRDSSSRARQQYNSDLRNWAKECIEILSELDHFLRGFAQPEIQAIRQLSWRLSATAYEGRLFFPNKEANHGREKDHAFQGFRPRVLDWLIYAYDLSLAVNTLPDDEAALIINKLKRGFTSDIQVALDPRNLSSSLEDFQKLILNESFLDVSQSHPTLVEAKELTKRRFSKRPLSEKDRR